MSTPASAEHVVAVRRHSHAAGLRTVSLFEAFKGMLALVLAILVSRAIRHDYDFEDLAERIFDWLHISISHRWSQHLLGMADKLSDVHPALILTLAGAYAVIRFAESYGLWKQRAWAEWLAIISGCMYLPIEIYKLVRHPNGIHWAILLTNIVVVLYIAWVRWDEIEAARAAERILDAGTTAH